MEKMGEMRTKSSVVFNCSTCGEYLGSARIIDVTSEEKHPSPHELRDCVRVLANRVSDL